MPKSLVELRDRERTEPDWILHSFLKRQNTAILLGQPKRACKSWLALDLCWSVSDGETPWGISLNGLEMLKPPRALRCVYFTQEDTEDDIHDRVLAHLTKGKREPNDRLWVVPKNLQVKFDTHEGRHLIQQELDWVREKAGAIDLVVFDPMRRMHNGDENDSATIGAMWNVIDRIHRRYNCSTIINHHTVKPPRGDARLDYDPTDPYTGRGSSDIYGGGDAFIVSLPKADMRNEQGMVMARKLEVHFESKRSASMPPAMLKVDFMTGGVKYLGMGWEQETKSL